MFALLGVAVALAVLSCLLASDTSFADNVKGDIFWVLLAVCPASFITGFIALFTKKKELGLWLILTSCVVASALFYSLRE